MRKGKQSRHSMSGKDTHGGKWVYGWGKRRRMTMRLERRIRERTARKYEERANG